VVKAGFRNFDADPKREVGVGSGRGGGQSGTRLGPNRPPSSAPSQAGYGSAPLGGDPAEGVWVLVGDREVVTDSNGRRSLERVPADLDPARTAVVRVAVGPDREATADFPLRLLGAIAGRLVAADPTMHLDQIMLRLGPGVRWAAAHRDGAWAYCGLPTADYAVEVDRTTVSGLAWRWGNATLVALQAGAELAGIVFEVSAGQ